jgi:hypothetical protein
MGAKGKNIGVALGAIVALGVAIFFGTRTKAAPPNGGNGGIAGNLHGTLTDAETGEPLVNAHVAIGCYSEDFPGYYWCADDYFDGEYCFDLEPGRYVVWCLAPGGYEDKYYYDFIVEEDTVLNIELDPGNY